jgi:hypothetical protein
MTSSVSFDKCNSENHRRDRHSPDGFNIIEECRQCMAAWQIMGLTGEVTRLSSNWMGRVLARERELNRSK